MRKLSNIHVVLSDVRKERGLSQREVAEALCVTQEAVSNYERGVRGIPLDGLLDKWLELLEIEVTITPKGHAPMKDEEYTERDLARFVELTRRRNYLIAELRSLAAREAMGDPVLGGADPETGENLFWPYSFWADHAVGLVQTRRDHPNQKIIAVAYTDEDVSVYRFEAVGGQQAGSAGRAYFTEDDFLAFGGIWSHEELEARKVTVLRLREKDGSDVVEVVSAEGFSLKTLLEMQETLLSFEGACRWATDREGYLQMEGELLQIECELEDLQIDNRLMNGLENPAFSLWNETDQAAVDVPLYSADRIWHWVEEGVSWVDDYHDEVSLRLCADPGSHEAYETLREADGGRVIGTIGTDKAPAVFKVNPAKPEVIHRVEVRLEDLTDEESERYDKIIESARELDELRNEEE